MAAEEDDVIPPLHKQKVEQPKFITVRGWIEAEGEESNQTIGSICDQNKPLDDKKVVFIFPGRADKHNSDEHKLYTKVEWGGGLAESAKKVSKKGYPCLSLPTIANKNGDPPTSISRQKAIAALWKALGNGYSLVLPVRNPTKNSDDNKFFTHALGNDGNDYEPNFYGGVVSEPDLESANEYCEQLATLKAFMNLAPDNRPEIGTGDEDITFKVGEKNYKIEAAYHQAYLEGQRALNAEEVPDWFDPKMRDAPKNSGELDTDNDSLTSLNSMLAPEKALAIKEKAEELGFTFRDDSKGSKKCHTYSKMGGKDGKQKLEFTVSAKKIAVKTNENMTYKDKQELAKAMFEAFINGHDPKKAPHVYTITTNKDPDLQRALEAEAKKWEALESPLLISKADHAAKQAAKKDEQDTTLVNDDDNEDDNKPSLK